MGAQGSRARRGKATITTGLLALALVASACTGADSEPATPTEATTTAPPCPVGESTTPPVVRDLTFDSVTAQTFRTTLTVPYAGLDGGALDRPSIVRAEVKTAASNAPVTFVAAGGRILDQLGDDWPNASDQLTVFSVAGTNVCVAGTYLFATKVGTVEFLAQGANDERATVEVVTVPDAARNVSVRASADAVLAGETVEAEITVTDVFGNRVPSATVVITTPRNGPGSFFNGSRRAVVLTDERGQASVELVTRAGRGDSLRINVRGESAACEIAINQFACDENQPVVGFAAAQSKVRASVAIRQPDITLTSPSAGTRLSAGQRFAVRATTAGVATGTLAQLKLGDAVIALGSVDEDGTLTMRDIVAAPTSSSNRYSLLIAELPRVEIDLVVLPFGITGAQSSEDEITFSIAAGAWPVGTRIALLRNDSQVSRATVVTSGSTLTITVPSAPGIYQVRARGNGVVIDGERPYPIL